MRAEAEIIYLPLAHDGDEFGQSIARDVAAEAFQDIDDEHWRAL